MLHTDRAYPKRITGAETDAFMELLSSRNTPISVTQAYYPILDAGHCSFSIAAAHRIVARTDRTATATHSARTGPQRAKPIILATAPNQLWSWDITMLHGPGKHTHRLYTIMESSPAVVGHRIETPKPPPSPPLSSQRVTETASTPPCSTPTTAHPCAPAAPSTHQSWASTVLSRPRSRRHPYSESLFKT